MQYHIDISGDEHNDFRTSFAKAIAIAIENGTDEVVTPDTNTRYQDTHAKNGLQRYLF